MEFYPVSYCILDFLRRKDGCLQPYMIYTHVQWARVLVSVYEFMAYHAQYIDTRPVYREIDTFHFSRTIRTKTA